MRTKQVFRNVELMLQQLRTVDNVYWNADAPSTSRPEVVGNYVSIMPTSQTINADNVTQIQQWQFLIYYIAEDINAHMDFIDELEQYVPVSVMSMYNKHRIVGWKPYSIIRIITNGNLASPQMTDDSAPQPQPR